MTFSVLVPVTADAFNATVQRRYIVDVARGLSLDPVAVSILSFSVWVSEGRRTSQALLEVVTAVAVPTPGEVLQLQQALARNELTVTISGSVVTLRVLRVVADSSSTTAATTTTTSTAAVTGALALTTTPQEGSMDSAPLPVLQLVLYFTGAALAIAAGIGLVWLCKRSKVSQHAGHARHLDGTWEPDPESRIGPGFSDIVPPAVWSAASQHPRPVRPDVEYSARPEGVLVDP